VFLWLRATFPRLPLRPDHAAGVEGADPDHSGVDQRRVRICLVPYRSVALLGALLMALTDTIKTYTLWELFKGLE